MAIGFLSDEAETPTQWICGERDRREILSFYNIEFVIVKLFGYFQISYAMTCSMTTISADDGGIITLYTHCYEEEDWGI